MNKNYGRIVNGIFEAYPWKYDTEKNEIVRPTDSEIQKDGWKEVICASEDPHTGNTRQIIKFQDIGEYIVRKISWIEE